MKDIFEMAQRLENGEILELKTPFVPAPAIDILKPKGFKVFSIKKKTIW